MNEIFVFYVKVDGSIGHYCYNAFDGSSMPKEMKAECEELIGENHIIVIGSNIHVRDKNNNRL